MSDAASTVSEAGRVRDLERRDARARVDTLSVADLACIGAAAVFWTCVVASVAIWRHGQFLSHRFDLGNMTQAVWSTTQGRILEMTDGTSGDQMVRMAAHVDPILILFAPLWWLVPIPEALAVGYVAVIASGIYPVVKLALKYTSSRLVAVLLGAWYFVLPWTIWIALNELNPLSLSLPLLLYAIWFLDEHRLVLFSLFAALTLAAGELLGLTVAAVGVWYALRRRRPATGVVIAAAGVAWTVICLAVIIPAYSDGEPSRYYSRFESIGGSPLGLLQTLVTSPGTVVAELTTRSDLVFLVWLVLPTALLCLRAPLLLIIALPQLGISMLAESPEIVSPLHHSSAPIVAALVVATVVGVARFPHAVRAMAAALPVVLAAVVLAFIPPRPGADEYFFGELQTPARRTAMETAIGLVPSSAPVTTTNRLGAHLSAREVVHLFPAWSDAQWAILDLRDPSNASALVGPIRFETVLRQLHADPKWHLVFDRENIRVYRKRL